jgi:opacity protein-like surface antigen
VGLSDATLMAGPGMRFGSRQGTTFFVRAVAGLVHDRATISVLDVDISESATRFAVLAGGGLERRITRTLAVQVQGDYLWTDVDEGESSGFRVSAGLAYRFGVPR